jgi:hypothetical protein
MHRILNRAARAAAIAATLLALGTASVAAHMQTVNPNGNADGFGPTPISNPWAMAHCQAAAPLHIAETSNGVVQFTPARAFDNCVPGTRGN